jgi:hypothetical protein
MSELSSDAARVFAIRAVWLDLKNQTFALRVSDSRQPAAVCDLDPPVGSLAISSRSKGLCSAKTLFMTKQAKDTPPQALPMAVRAILAVGLDADWSVSQHFNPSLRKNSPGFDIPFVELWAFEYLGLQVSTLA